MLALVARIMKTSKHVGPGIKMGCLDFGASFFIGTLSNQTGPGITMDRFDWWRRSNLLIVVCGLIV